MSEKFCMDFSFFTHRFSKKIYEMSDALGGCGTLYKVIKKEN